MSSDKDMSQSNRQSSTANKSEDNDEDTATIQVTREPFFAFVPQVIGWAAHIMSGELDAACRAIVESPKWSTEYTADAFSFYKENPKILANEVRFMVIRLRDKILRHSHGVLVFVVLIIGLFNGIGSFRIDCSRHAGKQHRLY